ncbi:MAG TPA: ABC transporter permease subunit [Acidimicrobiales bacterium]
MSDARIIDRGYRAYDGPRLGQRGAMRSLVRHTARAVLGIRQPARQKLVALLAAVIAYLPAVVFVGLAALIPDERVQENFLPTYGEYYSFITSALVVFAAFVAPEALCPDRRTGLLGMYLAAPLTRGTYVASKLAAVIGLLSLATLGPPLLMLVANVLQNMGPDSPIDVLVLLLRIVVCGVLVAVQYTAVSLGVSSLTDRRAVASAGTLLLIVVTGAVVGALVGGVGMSRSLLGFNLMFGPFELVRRVYGEVGSEPSIPTWVLGLQQAGWTTLGLGVLWWRYRRLQVTR